MYVIVEHSDYGTFTYGDLLDTEERAAESVRRLQADADNARVPIHFTAHQLGPAINPSTGLE